MSVGVVGVTASAVATVATLAVVSAAFGATVSFLHRLYSREASPLELNVLSGLGAVAVWLNTAGALTTYAESGSLIVAPEAVAVNLSSLGAGGVAAVYAGKLGDRVGVELSNLPDYDGNVARLVRSAGRNVTVRVPEADEIRDIDGYDPVSDGTKSEVAGKEYVFPRGLTVEELRARFVDRLREEDEIGYVDAEIDDRGNVEHLGLGREVSGIGPTLAPGTCAVAVRADPAYASSAGDTVRLYAEGEAEEGAESEDESRDERSVERVADAELRAAAGDVVTVALDRRDARALTPDGTYRLATSPLEKLPEREFAAMLRSADETVAVVDIAEGSPLVGARLDSLGVTVVAVETDGGVSAVPDKTRGIAAGDTVYAVGRPKELRRLEAA